MGKIKIIDLHFQKTKDAIASFLIETSEGPILIETGPASTFDQLSRGVSKCGHSIDEIKHVLLTHIHFDHAGAAWKLAEAGAKIYVHPFGVPHLASPEKLWNSASQIYGDDMDRLWGKMKPIAANLLVGVEDKQDLEFGTTKIKSIHTPGHAVHHIAWKMGDIIFTGDVAGVKIAGGQVLPPCPPPDINLEDWKNSLAIIKGEKPTELYLTHFGIIDQVDFHLDSLSYILEDWAEWVRPYFEKNVDQSEVVPLFMEYSSQYLIKEGCSKTLIQTYEYANPSWMSVAGLYRYWKLKSQGRLK